MYFNFLNFPVIRFTRPTAETLDSFYALIYKKFKTDEDTGNDWKEQCMDALEANDAAKIKELEKQGGKIIFIDDIIDILIDNYTRNDSNLDFEYFKNLVLKNPKYIKDIEFKDNPKQIVFTSTEGVFRASKLSDIFPVFKDFPNIENADRHGKCHQDSMVVSEALQDDNKVATGYIYTFGEGEKALHSWVEVTIDGKPFVVDTTRNLLMPRKFYYMIRNINGPVYKISKRTLEREKQIFDFLHMENEWLIKLYLSNRHQALQLYKVLQQTKEQEKMQDPLYAAAKNMSEGFNRMEREFQRQQKQIHKTKEQDLSSKSQQ